MNKYTYANPFLAKFCTIEHESSDLICVIVIRTNKGSILEHVFTRGEHLDVWTFYTTAQKQYGAEWVWSIPLIKV